MRPDAHGMWSVSYTHLDVYKRQVSLGDYSAGSTHVLPTAGCACHSSGLNVHSFRKQVHVIDYSAEALRTVAGVVETFAAAEDLPAHGAAVTLRRHA